MRWQYIENVPYPRKFVLYFSKGNTVHSALQRIAEALRSGRTPIAEADVMDMALMRLPPEEFPSAEARMAEVRDVLRCVHNGRRYIERLRNPRWLLIERHLRREWNLFRETGPYKVVAKPDVIVQHEDEDGRRLVEIIDYKTGTRWMDEAPPVMMRFVARQLLETEVGDVESAQLRFTYLWLQTGQSDVIDMTPDYMSHYWDQTFREMKQLARESGWPATPSFRCNYCPYYRNVCTEEIPYDGISL